MFPGSAAHQHRARHKNGGMDIIFSFIILQTVVQQCNRCHLRIEARAIMKTTFQIDDHGMLCFGEISCTKVLFRG